MGGNIITFIRQLGDSGIPEVDEKFGLFIDFEKETIESDEEQMVHDLYNRIDVKIGESSELLKFLSEYGPGGQKIISEAISKPGDPEIQEEAWEKMLPLINNLMELKLKYAQLNQMIPELLGQMWATKTGRESACLLEVFRQRESLLIQLGKILDINMRFDELKMSAPTIPNDISYVKRQSTVRRRTNKTTTVDPSALEELSMFYISVNPALTNVINTITQFFKNEESKDGPLDLIVVFCKVCIKVLDTDIRSKFTKFGTIIMLHRIMVATALLYDHLHSEGVFVKESPINITTIVELLEDEAGLKRRRTRSIAATPTETKGREMSDPVKDSTNEVAEQARILLNVLKYSSKHLQSETTPRAVKAMFAKIV